MGVALTQYYLLICALIGFFLEKIYNEGRTTIYQLYRPSNN